ncbi:protein SRG1 [Triticum aestivum]|nr:protein SRG1-like [Triticum aestivum]
MPQQDRPSAAAGVAPIPVVDLGRLSRPDADGGAVEEEAKLRWALETWGFFMITNHGIEASLMDAMMNASKEFFGQPTEEKQKYNNIIDGKRFRLEGYRSELLQSEGQTLDWSCRLSLQVEPEGERSFHLWPKYPKSLRDVLLQYASRTKIIKDCIMRALANLLELDEDYFINRTTTRARALARLGYYPPCPRPDLVLGFKPHYDGGALSILFIEENVGGLQVLRNGKWYNVLAKPCTLLINIAECIEIMSNGIFKSPPHRVLTNAEKERTSVAIFYGVDVETVVEPAPGLLDEKRLARFKKIKAEDYYGTVFEHFRQGKRLIDTLII